VTDDQKQAAIINAVGAYLNDCRPPLQASTQQAGQAIASFNELVKPLVDAINARAAKAADQKIDG
jgi:hypothetical protein